eukprot:3575865-Pleurochrysis_carterae.AAC.1
MYSAPASRAAVRSEAVRRISSLASVSSRACAAGTFGRPRGCSRERTTGADHRPESPWTRSAVK